MDNLQPRSLEPREFPVSPEAQRRASEAERARLAAILLSMADAVVVIDGQGNRVLANDACERMFARRDLPLLIEDKTGRPLSADETLVMPAARGESFRVEFRMSLPDGARRWFEAKGEPIRSEAQRGGGVIVIRDITDHAVRQLQEEFMAEAGHELRTPLTAIQGYLQLLSKRPEVRQSELLAKYVGTALSESKRLARLVGELADASRLQSGKLELELEQVELKDIVHRAVEIARALTHQEIAVREADEVRVVGDPDRLQQVVFNLLTNAIVHAADSEYVDVVLRRVDDHAELQVSDTGPGIPAEDLPLLFSRLYEGVRRGHGRRRGLGLGLFICKEIVSAHGGEIAVETTDREGTTFTVRLPLSSGETGYGKAPAPRHGEATEAPVLP